MNEARKSAPVPKGDCVSPIRFCLAHRCDLQNRSQCAAFVTDRIAASALERSPASVAVGLLENGGAA